MNLKSYLFLAAAALLLTACTHEKFLNNEGGEKESEIVEEEGSVNEDESEVETEDTTVDKVIIKVTDAGFEPSVVNIKKGETVTWENTGATEVWVASAPHPTHTNYPEFDQLAGMDTSETWSFTFDKVGDWKYHDHLNPARRGQVVVTEP